jgi:hypothetical protein
MLQQAVSAGSMGVTLASLAAQAAGDDTRRTIEKVIEPIQSHFRSALDEARTDFRAQFPDAATLARNAGIDQLRDAYYAALRALRAPDARRTLLMASAILFTSDKDRAAAVRLVEQGLATTGNRADDLRTYADAGAAYQTAMIDLQVLVSTYQAKLPDIAGYVRRRAAVLHSAGADLEEVFWAVIRSPATALPVAYYESFGIYRVSKVFQGLGDHMTHFSREINDRANGYQRLWDEVDKQILLVDKQLANPGSAIPPRSGSAP